MEGTKTVEKKQEKENKRIREYVPIGPKRPLIPSDNTRDADEKGYYRKTFIIDTELGRTMEAFAWYFRLTEKQMIAQALERFFRDVDPKVMKKCIDQYANRETGDIFTR